MKKIRIIDSKVVLSPINIHYSVKTLVTKGWGYHTKLVNRYFMNSSFSLWSCNYSTGCVAYDSNNSINPVVTYLNVNTFKLQIIKENRKKSGIYRWTNLKKW